MMSTLTIEEFLLVQLLLCDSLNYELYIFTYFCIFFRKLYIIFFLFKKI